MNNIVKAFVFKSVFNTVIMTDINDADTTPNAAQIDLCNVMLGLMLLLMKNNRLTNESAQKTYFETIGTDSQKRVMVGENIKIPNTPPSPIGSKKIMLDLKCFVMFAIESNISSNTPKTIAVVPPLTPGIRVPAPMRIPFRKPIKKLFKNIAA